MAGKVIQGLFIAGRLKLPAAVVQPKAMPHPPGPPTPAFGRRSPVAQPRRAGDAIQVDPGQLGLVSGGGWPLPDGVRGKMEAALGADFSDVRVHVGPQAARIGAIALTLGADIYFAPGRFQPDTVHGQQVLGHELAHVMQQRAGRVRNPMGSGVAVVQDRTLEAEADRLGHRAAAHRLAVQPKLAPLAAQSSSSPVRISPPNSAGRAGYRFTAGAAGRQIGSVTVRARDRGLIEVTNLSVDPAHREHGIGKMLLASAARIGQRFAKTKVTLASQDNGSGRLTHWYKEMGFAQVGINQRGYPKLEAMVGTVLRGAVQRFRSESSRSNSNRFPQAASGNGQGGLRGTVAKVVPVEASRRYSKMTNARTLQRAQSEAPLQAHDSFTVEGDINGTNDLKNPYGCFAMVAADFNKQTISELLKGKGLPTPEDQNGFLLKTKNVVDGLKMKNALAHYGITVEDHNIEVVQPNTFSDWINTAISHLDEGESFDGALGWNGHVVRIRISNDGLKLWDPQGSIGSFPLDQSQLMAAYWFS